MVSKRKRRGLYELLTENEHIYLNNYKSKNSLRNYSNIRELKKDIKKKAGTLNKVELKNLLNHLLLLINENQSSIKLLTHMARFLAYNTSNFPLLEERYLHYIEERNKKVAKILKNPVFKKYRATGTNISKLKEDIDFLKLTNTRKRYFNTLIRSLTIDFGWDGELTSKTKKFTSFINTLQKRKIITAQIRSRYVKYCFTPYGLSVITVFSTFDNECKRIMSQLNEQRNKSLNRSVHQFQH